MEIKAAKIDFMRSAEGSTSWSAKQALRDRQLKVFKSRSRRSYGDRMNYSSFPCRTAEIFIQKDIKVVIQATPFKNKRTVSR